MRRYYVFLTFFTFQPLLFPAGAVTGEGTATPGKRAGGRPWPGSRLPPWGLLTSGWDATPLLSPCPRRGTNGSHRPGKLEGEKDGNGGSYLGGLLFLS